MFAIIRNFVNIYHIFVPCSKQLKISECINDMEAYTHLTDNILFKILDTESEEENMKAAKELINRLFSRDLYKCVYHSKPIDPRRMKDVSMCLYSLSSKLHCITFLCLTTEDLHK